ncbi:MAG: phosphate ABC transporter permease, partial [Gammaproteobacteria bacterium]
MFVLLAITVIFFYLLYEVWPLFQSAKVEPQARHATATVAAHVDIDEYRETGIRIEADGRVQYFRVGDNSSLGEARLPLPDGVTVSTVVRGSITSALVGLGLSDGRLLVVQPVYDTALSQDNQREVTPGLVYPYGETPLALDDSGAAIGVFALRGDDTQLTVMGQSQGRLLLSRFETG